jgi:SET domain-containing protein
MFSSIHARWGERKLVSTRNSKIHGLGVFANRSIGPSQVLACYDGEILSAEEAKRELAAGNRYLLELPDGRVLDGSASHQLGRFFNYSCDPSAHLEYRGGVSLIISSRAIVRGEEITIDYGFEPSELTRFPCTCGKPNCVGYIIAVPYHPMVRRVWGRQGNAEIAGDSGSGWGDWGNVSYTSYRSRPAP